MKSVPRVTSGRSGPQPERAGKARTGRRLTLRPSRWRSPWMAAPGLASPRRWSQRGAPAAPKRTASASRQSCSVASGRGRPSASMAAPAIGRSVSSDVEVVGGGGALEDAHRAGDDLRADAVAGKHDDPDRLGWVWMLMGLPRTWLLETARDKRRGLPRSGGALFRGGGSALRRAPLLRTGGSGPCEGFASGELFRGVRDVHRRRTIRADRLRRQPDLGTGPSGRLRRQAARGRAETAARPRASPPTAQHPRRGSRASLASAPPGGTAAGSRALCDPWRGW